MKKIFWLIVLVVVWYCISIFLAPTFADKIADLFWIQSYNEQIRWTTKNINKISTNVPNVDELQKTYSDTIKSVKDWIEKTKNIIDDTRATLSWTEDTINKAVDIYDKVSETWKKIKDTLNDVDEMNKKIQWVVNTDNVK